MAIRLVLVVALFAASASLYAQAPTPDSLVHRIFASLKAKDQQAFVALYPNGPQFSRFMRTIMEQAFKSEQMREMMGLGDSARSLNIDSLIDKQVAIFSTPEMAANMQAEFGKTFQKIIEKGENKGVNWSEAKLTSFSLDTTSMEGVENIPFKLDGIKEANGVIDFMVGDSAYQLVFNKMMYIQNEGGWFGAEFPQLARKGESLLPDAEDAEMVTDTVVSTFKEEAPPPPAPVKPKAKSKTGTKTPARKTKTKA